LGYYFLGSGFDSAFGSAFFGGIDAFLIISYENEYIN
jgi:hypothetical protein